MSEYIREIFLIDDNQFDNEFHEHVIRSTGFGGNVIILESGLEAIRKIETSDLDIPRLIFLDINMPGMDGFEVAERITPLLRTAPKNHVYLLTSSRWAKDIERASRIPIIQSFITKPLASRQLNELLAANSPAQ